MFIIEFILGLIIDINDYFIVMKMIGASLIMFYDDLNFIDNRQTNFKS